LFLKGACPVCRSMESTTFNRLLALGRGPRFIAPRFGLHRVEVRRHQRECFPQMRDEVAQDLARLGGSDES
jgi:hypothetical protein